MVSLLTGSGLVTNEDLVCDHLFVRHVAGRNENFIATFEDRPGYFLKYAREADAHPGYYLEIEARAYEQARASASLTAVMPPVCLVDLDRNVLILRHLRAGDASVVGSARIASALGEAIANIHLVEVDRAGWSFLPERPPWGLQLARPRPAALRTMSSAQARILRIVQKRPEVTDRLDQLREAWEGMGLTHGDLKWTNVIVEEGLEEDGAPRIRVIDWELVSLGDSAWDVGSVFHSYLAQGIATLDLPANAGPEDASAAFARKLPVLMRHHRLFWEAYAATAGLTPEEGPELARRATLYCGARLIQSAYEWSDRERTIDRAALSALQLGANILARPDDALRRVIGIDGHRPP